MTEHAGPAPAKDSQVSLFRTRFRQMRVLLAICLWMLIAVGIVLRLTIRDQHHLPGLFYYATPVPACAIYALIACVLGSVPGQFRRSTETATRNRFRWTFWITSSVFVVLLVWAMWTELVFHLPASSQTGDFRLVFWNTARIHAGRNKIAERLKSLQPACIGLVESEIDLEVDVEAWQRELPDYEIVPTDFGGMLAVKGDLISHQSIALPARASCERFDLRIEGQEFTLLLVDVASDLLRSRRRPLNKLAEVASELADRPVVIVGDFNTPDDSVLFEPLRNTLKEAFRDRGWGLAPTWPSLCPVLTLDQVWFNPRIDVSSCEHGWTLLSDHRPVICNIHVR